MRKLLMPAAVIGGGLGFYWLWRKAQLVDALQVSVDGFQLPNKIKVRFRNAAAANVRVDAVFLNLYLGNVFIGEVNSNAPFTIQGRAQTSVDLTLLINMGTLLQTAGNLVPVIQSIMAGGAIPKNMRLEGFISAAGNKIQVTQALN